ncbi:MAG TPA: glycosyltransferase, partial [Solirubrobacteraceae bacterium]|nr:glycosyltransferase [Solirubrobacteraceae bacterium]
RPIAAIPEDRDVARASFGIGPREQCVLVFGGSLGARSINHAALDAFARSPFRVLHVCGARDHSALAARELREGYELISSLPPERFAAALLAADLVVARAGGSVFEIAASGVPAILVPYPHAAADHQLGNAAWMADAGAAAVIADDALDAPRLAAEVDALLADPERLGRMARAARGLARPDAALEVARELLAAAEARER